MKSIVGVVCYCLPLSILLVGCVSERSPVLATLPTEIPHRLMCDQADAMARIAEQTSDLEKQRRQHFIALADICILPVEDVTIDIASRRLADEQFVFDITGDQITLYDRAPKEVEQFIVIEAPGDAQIVPPQSDDDPAWHQLDDEIRVSRWRLRDIEQSLIYKSLFTQTSGVSVLYHGTSAPEALGRPHRQPSDQARGVTKLELYSPQLDETRRINLYRPEISASTPIDSVLYLADGDDLFRIAPILDEMIASRKIKPLYVVGLASGNGAIVTGGPDTWLDVRSADYAPGLEPSDRFAKHLSFVVDTVMPWAESQLGLTSRPDRHVAGYSNGAVFALNAAIRHPDLFTSSVVMSPGWCSVNPDEAKKPGPVFYISAGLYEPRFHASARTSAAALSDAGHAVFENYYATQHSHFLLETLLASRLEQILGEAS